MEILYSDNILKENIIDIRSELEYNKKRIAGSKNIPRLLLMSDPEKYLNKNNNYFLLCDKGKVSLTCAKILKSFGYRCCSIKGGIQSLILK